MIPTIPNPEAAPIPTPIDQANDLFARYLVGISRQGSAYPAQASEAATALGSLGLPGILADDMRLQADLLGVSVRSEQTDSTNRGWFRLECLKAGLGAYALSGLQIDRGSVVSAQGLLGVPFHMVREAVTPDIRQINSVVEFLYDGEFLTTRAEMARLELRARMLGALGTLGKGMFVQKRITRLRNQIVELSTGKRQFPDMDALESALPH